MNTTLRTLLLLTTMFSANAFCQNELAATIAPAGHHVHMLAEGAPAVAGESSSVRKFLLSKVHQPIDMKQLVIASSDSDGLEPASPAATQEVVITKRPGGNKVLRWFAKQVKRPVQALRGTKASAA